VSLRYVYAIGRGAGVPAGLRGMNDRPVRAERGGALVAYTSDVDDDEFGEEALNRNLSDMAWLTPRAVRHQEVNAALASAIDPLAPLSFGTVFRDEVRVQQMLVDRAGEIAARLDALRGKAEWIAVVRRDEQRALAALESTSAELRAVRSEIGAASPGRAYLVTRRLDETKRQELRASDATATAAAVVALEATGASLFREPLVDEAGGGMIARYSVLAGRDDGPRLERAREQIAEDWDDRGYALELTGPWPAYRFANVTP
jgi:gas vesicle protein GvpL/GvpF